MEHIALYRKYRSQTFDDLVGQQHVVNTLKAAVDQGRISQAFLFTGPRGTGKTSTARLLAKALNCTNGPSSNPDPDDPICKEIAAGTCMDVIELDAASESNVDKVREAIVEASEYRPAYCRYKIFIIDEVHDLSKKAFDALLKTIEEPHPFVVYILATTELRQVPETIRSRCQRYEFHRGRPEDIERRIAYVAESEGIQISAAACSLIARMADGAFRDALGLLEQLSLAVPGAIDSDQVYQQMGFLTEDEVDALLRHLTSSNFAEILDHIETSYHRGRDARTILESILLRLADLTRIIVGVQQSKGETSSPALAAAHSVGAELGLKRILYLRNEISATHRLIRDISLPRIWLESELLRLAANQPVETVPPAIAPQTPQAPPKERRQEAAVQTTPPDTSDLARVWKGIVHVLAEKSRTAQARLANSAVARLENGAAVVVLSRQVDVDYAQENTKVAPEIRRMWREAFPQGPNLVFERSGVEASNLVEETRTRVDSELEGAALKSAAKDILLSND